MINGVLQRLTIVEASPTRFILREQPLLSRLITALLAVIAVSLLIFQLYTTAIIAFVIAGIFLLDAHSRVIVFDAAANSMTIEHVYLYKCQRVNTLELHTLRKAYLHTAEDGHTQIILIDGMGDEFGLSVYSRDVRPWKAEIVTAINTILREAHNSTVLPT
jgi:EamA domain-containing membrane protein RarD